MNSCRSIYNSYPPVSVREDCLTKLGPRFENELYKAQVDITGRSLGGLLLIKKMPDSSTRIVFSTEMGVKFFDFEFRENGEFKVVDILKKLNRKPVISALRQDFEILLMQERGKIPERILEHGNYLYHGYSKGKKQAWYLTDKNCQNLVGAELSSTRKPLVRLNYFYQGTGNPDSIQIRHLNFSFNIALKKLER
ncbi:MAG: hypothetical protein KAF40_05250 [Flavihumibacter sp.]|nr:hypothetical protein [Flavihumibacter sp.]